jgi:hypothetical protein
MTNLETRYSRAQEDEDAIVAKIRKACAAFMASTPDYYPIPENERRMIQTMQQNDQLSPTSLGGWQECFAVCREQLQPRPRRERNAATNGKRLSHDDIDRMTATQYQRRLESDPNFAEQVNALGPRN